MTRMTTSTANAIMEDLLKHRFQPIVRELASRSAKIAHLVYERVLSEEHRTLLESLPEGFVADSRCVLFVTPGGHRHKMFFCGWHGLCDLFGVRLEPVYRRVPRDYLVDGEKRDAPILHDEDVLNELKEFTLASDRAWKQQEDMRTQVYAAVKSFSTVEALIKAWPELEPFAKKHLTSDAKSQLPAVAVAKLNEMLNLPVE